jgi:hypothetical protein
MVCVESQPNAPGLVGVDMQIIDLAIDEVEHVESEPFGSVH